MSQLGVMSRHCDCSAECLPCPCAFNRSVQHRLQSIGWRLEAQGLSRALIEPQSNRVQTTLFPECLEDWIDENNPVRVIDAFVDKLDLCGLGFDGAAPEATGRPSYHPSILLKLYVYGYLVRVQSSRRLEREAGRNVEVMWLTGRLTPDHKTIADFRKDSGPAIKQVCVQFIELCRQMGLLTTASVAIDGSKFKAVNTRDKNFTRGKVERRRAQLEKSVARYLAQLDTADLQEPSEELAMKTAHLKEKLVKLESEMKRLVAHPRLPRSMSGGLFIVSYRADGLRHFPLTRRVRDINSTDAGRRSLAVMPKTARYKHKEGRHLCTRIPR